MIEKALFIDDEKQLENSDKFTRIYFGAEFCQNLIPRPAEVKKIIRKIRKGGKNITFMTPFVTNDGLEKVNAVLEYLDKDAAGCEVVFNDWGVFKIIRDNFRNIEPVMGRLLVKQQKDPMIGAEIFNSRAKSKVFSTYGNSVCVSIRKTIPAAVRRYFRATSADNELTQRYLLDNGIKRMEMDNLPWGMKIKIRKQFGLSMHFPYGYITTTRLCGLLNLTYSKCRKECKKYYLELKNYCSEPVYISGNTVFYKSKMPDISVLKKHNIDRIVFSARKYRAAYNEARQRKGN
jgi:hypothetical protein